MEYQRIDVEKYDPKGSFDKINPFTMAFCRTRDKGNVLLVGGLNKVESEVKKLGPALVSFRLWHDGRSRGYTHLENMPAFYMIPKRYLWLREGYGRKERGYVVRRNDTREEVCSWRRIPSTFPRALRQLP